MDLLKRVFPTLLLLGCCAQFGYAGRVTVQPIQVCTDSGQQCANPGRELFDSFTQTAWAQAGLNVEFLDWTVIYSSAFFNIPDERRLDLLWSLPAITTGSSVTGGVVSMWFVNSIVTDAFGVSAFPGNQIVISDAIFRFNNPLFRGDVQAGGGTFVFHGGPIPIWTGGPDVGRVTGDMAGRTDTIAHELGHSLGLDHCDPQCSGPFLMAASRTIPSNVSQIQPVGPLDTLTGGEVRVARGSNLVDQSIDFELSYVALIPVSGDLAGAVIRNKIPIFGGEEFEVYEPVTPGGSWGVGQPGDGGSGSGTNPPSLPPVVSETVATVPEPGTYSMIAAGLLLLVAGRLGASRRAGR